MDIKQEGEGEYHYTIIDMHRVDCEREELETPRLVRYWRQNSAPALETDAFPLLHQHVVAGLLAFTTLG